MTSPPASALSTLAVIAPVWLMPPHCESNHTRPVAVISSTAMSSDARRVMLSAVRVEGVFCVMLPSKPIGVSATPLVKPEPALSTMSPFSPDAAVAVMAPPSRMLVATELFDTTAANTWLAVVVPFRVGPGRGEGDIVVLGRAIDDIAAAAAGQSRAGGGGHDRRDQRQSPAVGGDLSAAGDADRAAIGGAREGEVHVAVEEVCVGQAAGRGQEAAGADLGVAADDDAARRQDPDVAARRAAGRQAAVQDAVDRSRARHAVEDDVAAIVEVEVQGLGRGDAEAGPVDDRTAGPGGDVGGAAAGDHADRSAVAVRRGDRADPGDLRQGRARADGDGDAQPREGGSGQELVAAGAGGRTGHEMSRAPVGGAGWARTARRRARSGRVTAGCRFPRTGRRAAWPRRGPG